MIRIRFRSSPVVLIAILVAQTMSSAAWAQAHEPNPEAMKAFGEMLKAWRSLPGLEVRTTIKIEMMEGDVAASSDEIKGEFTFGPNRRAIVKLRGFTCYLTPPAADAKPEPGMDVVPGSIAAVHEGDANDYFISSDDGSPYYALLNCFVDMPFPELAIILGEESPEDVVMQFHSKSPWLQPTAVTLEQKDGQEVRRLTLTSDFNRMEVFLDPQTNLMKSATLEISGGELVRDGATLVYRYAWEYPPVETPLDADAFTFKPGDRQRVDLMAALIPRPAQAPDDEDGGGEGGVQGGALVGAPAPPVTLATADGKAFDLADMQGRVVVLDFWASWCGPCMQGLPKLHEVAKWASQEQLPVTVMTVNVWEIRPPNPDSPDARLSSALKTWKAKEFTLPIAMDYSDETAGAYRVSGIPTTVIIRSDGVVHNVHVGVADPETLKKDIQAAIKAVEPGM